MKNKYNLLIICFLNFFKIKMANLIGTFEIEKFLFLEILPDGPQIGENVKISYIFRENSSKFSFGFENCSISYKSGELLPLLENGCPNRSLKF